MKQSSGRKEESLLGKVLYALLFCGIFPSYLIFWTSRLGHVATPDVPPFPLLGIALVGFGGLLMVFGILALWIHGRGLPMNAYPPENYVRQGIYRWLNEPIYSGFALICFGLSLALQSGAGFWVISPFVVLACTALVHGYERQDLIRRFGGHVSPPWFRLPPDDAKKPEFRDIISVIFLVFVPWLILYEMVEFIGVVPPVWTSTLEFENDLPVIGVSAIPYALIYPLVIVAPIFASRRDHLKQFAIGGLLATALIIPFYLTVPIVAPFRDAGADVLFAEFLRWQQGFDRPITAFPAFHVVWLCLAIRLYQQAYPNMRILLWVLAVIIVISCWTTGMHALLDIPAGVAVYLVILFRTSIWAAFLKFFERIANSWREWHFGSTRVINHGLYAGAAACVGYLIVGFIVGPGMFWASIVVGVSIILGAGIWGQILVGSKKLLRPFGYYGAVVGAACGTAFASLVFDQSIMPLVAALSVAAPWIQAVGRFRCLIQGCCHGARTSEAHGIHYRHPKSRVLQIAKLGGEPVHPTPVYSMISNMLLGFILMRLLSIGAPASFIVGCYLMLNGLARFVEEAYRGEPQTQILAGLKIYQWTALISIWLGTVFTMLPAEPVNLQNLGITPLTLLGSMLMGVFVAVAMGVDWPASNRRFSRLI